MKYTEQQIKKLERLLAAYNLKMIDINELSEDLEKVFSGITEQEIIFKNIQNNVDRITKVFDGIKCNSANEFSYYINLFEDYCNERGGECVNMNGYHGMINYPIAININNFFKDYPNGELIIEQLNEKE